MNMLTPLGETLLHFAILAIFISMMATRGCGTALGW